MCGHTQGWVVILNHELPWPDDSAISVPWGQVRNAEGLQAGVRCWFGWFDEG